jgi:hypothetical protein
MARIERLTPEEEALIPIVREAWGKIGLATGPGDRAVAQAAIADTYRQAGLLPPERWIWLGSPWAGCIGAWMLAQSPSAGKSVLCPVLDQLRSEIGAEVRAQVSDHISVQVREQVWRPVCEKVWDRVGDHIWEQIENGAPDLDCPEARAQLGKAGQGQHEAGWLLSRTCSAARSG